MVGCAPEPGGEVTTDVGFIGDASAEDDGSSDTSEPISGCDLLRTEPCATAETACCAVDERCVPSADGTNVCVAAGDRGRGEECGQAGFDNCAAGLLCAAPEPGASLQCRRLCGADLSVCGTGSRCVLDGTLPVEQVGLCSP